MNRAVAAGVMVTALILAQLGMAQELRPEAVPADRQSPRGTLKVLRTAMEAGDAEQIRSILAAGSDLEKAMVDSMAQTAVSAKRLHDAAVATFGQEQARPLTGEPSTPGADGLTDLDRAVETISDDGTTAIVSFQDINTDPIKLTLADEQWVIPVSELKQLDPQTMAARMAEVTALNAIVDEIAAEVAQNKYKTAEEARQALYDRLVQLAQAASTQPTTRPTTGPSR